ncbi:hypothetical protein BC830DRAFT_795424 [Chytriomyces sp. MP71]|nr:hypothetical protein BC830DRAFT_795424 [Chytriomyces sp. MP71]
MTVQVCNRNRSILSLTTLRYEWGGGLVAYRPQSSSCLHPMSEKTASKTPFAVEWKLRRFRMEPCFWFVCCPNACVKALYCAKLFARKIAMNATHFVEELSRFHASQKALGNQSFAWIEVGGASVALSTSGGSQTPPLQRPNLSRISCSNAVYKSTVFIRIDHKRMIQRC